MQHYLPSGHSPIDRSQLHSRQGPRDDMRQPGRLLLIVPGDSQAMKKTLADQGDPAGTKFTRRHHCHGASVVLIASHGGRCIDHC